MNIYQDPSPDAPRERWDEQIQTQKQKLEKSKSTSAMISRGSKSRSSRSRTPSSRRRSSKATDSDNNATNNGFGMDTHSKTNNNHHKDPSTVFGKSGRSVLTPHKKAKDKKKGKGAPQQQKSFASDVAEAASSMQRAATSTSATTTTTTTTQQFQTQQAASSSAAVKRTTASATAPLLLSLKSGGTKTSNTVITTPSTSISAKPAPEIESETDRGESMMSPKRRRLSPSETTASASPSVSPVRQSKSHQSQSPSRPSPSASIHLATLIQQPPDLTLIPSVDSGDFDDTNLSLDSTSTSSLLVDDTNLSSDSTSNSSLLVDDDSAPTENDVQEEDIAPLQKESCQLPIDANGHAHMNNAIIHQDESTADQPLITPSNPDQSVVARRSGGVKMDLSPLFASPAAKTKTKLKAPPKQAVDDDRNVILKETSTVEGPTPVLTLGNFQESIWLDFGDDRENVVGKTRSYPFLVKAPPSLDDANAVTLVEVEKVPTKKGFLVQYYDTNSSSNNNNESSEIMSGGRFVITVKQGSSARCALLWTPAVSGGMREVVHL